LEKLEKIKGKKRKNQRFQKNQNLKKSVIFGVFLGLFIGTFGVPSTELNWQTRTKLVPNSFFYGTRV